MSTPPSGDQYHSAEPAESASQINKKRSTRACDQCRRTKSKCRKPADPNKPCSNCIIADLTCTFQGPSYKRGPPKGYINAIEQRLHQVEAVLGAIISSKDQKAQDIIRVLKTDSMAREIIERVDQGPYGSSSRTSRTGPADFSVTIRQINESREGRSTRDSRVNRESLSSSYPIEDIPSPTPEWLRRLDDILVGRFERSASSPLSPSLTHSVESHRLGASTEGIPESEEDAVEKAEDQEAIGSLSVNENDEIRYHNDSSGMSLLDRIADNTSGRNPGGIWRLPMARIWPYAPMQLAEMGISHEPIPLNWPSREQERLLIELYFTYAHPDLPVIHKPGFMALYQSHLPQTSPPSHASDNLQTKLAQLLMLAVFTVASRFNDREMPMPGPGRMWEAGCNYLASARRILYSVIHTGSLITCQALVILAYREFGLGAVEQSSTFMSMAIHMAQDLGLHRIADRWQRYGTDIFSADQKQERKHVWWSCAIAEKYISCALGRPTVIRSNDYDTELPEDRSDYHQSPFGEEVEVWQPHAAVTASTQPPVLCHTLSTFKAAASLSIITGRIIEKIYCIRQKPWSKKQKFLHSLARDLDDWFSSLPAHLHYDITSRRPVPPQILLLHIQHSVSVILLHRKFIPRVNHTESAASAHGIDTEQEFHFCHDAAVRISSLAATFRETFSLKAVSAYLPSYLMSAGIVHLAAIAMNHGDRGSSITALRNTLDCLKDMELVWPSATRNYELLGSAWAKFEADMQSFVSDPSQTPLSGPSSGSHGASEVNEENARMMAQLLGLEIPGVEPSTVHSPSWARAPSSQHLHGSSSSSRTAFSPASADYSEPVPLSPSTGPLHGRWMQEYPDSSVPFHGYDFQSFTHPDSYY